MLNATIALTPDRLDELIRYDPLSGDLIWKSRSDGLSARGIATFNGRFAGEIAGSDYGDGYVWVAITDHGQTYKLGAHKIAWAIHTRGWPFGEVDHINRIPSDNRISNLRDVSHAENQRNLSVRKGSRSGVTGVSWHAASGKWRSTICMEGVSKYLGVYPCVAEAIKARRGAEASMGFHINHGIEGEASC